MDKWDLLYIGTAYVEVHTFKWKDYVTVKDFSTTTNALSKKVLELEEENRKLKERIDELEKCNLNLQERLDRKEEVNKKMREEIKDHQLYEEKLEHRIIEFEELLHWE